MFSRLFCRVFSKASLISSRSSKDLQLNKIKTADRRARSVVVLVVSSSLQVSKVDFLDKISRAALAVSREISADSKICKLMAAMITSSKVVLQISKGSLTRTPMK